MSTANFFAGRQFRLNRLGPLGTESAVYLGQFITQDFKRANETEAVFLPDLVNPNAIPTRQSIVKSQSNDITASGIYDAKMTQLLEADFNAGTPVYYQIIVDELAAVGGGTYKGLYLVKMIDTTKSDNGMPRISVTLEGLGMPVFTVAAL